MEKKSIKNNNDNNNNNDNGTNVSFESKLQNGQRMC